MINPATDQVTLTVGGQRHDGWTAVAVSRAIDTMCGSFRLELTERWADSPTRFALEAGAACTVQVAGETLITGWIDRIDVTIEREDHVITIDGRDRAGDLVDCSAVVRPGSWRNTSIETIAKAIAAPFGVSVTARASTGPALHRFALQHGETVQQALERLCRFAGLLAISTPAGNVELIVPANDAAPVARLVEGENILQATASHDTTERFSLYMVKGQASGDDHASGKTVASPSGQATDPGVKRYRPLIVIAEEQATRANCGKRALWEASTRAGKAQHASVTVTGWRRPDGQLYAPNTIVSLDAPSLFMSGRMLVQGVTFGLDDRGGTLTTLALVPPDAWRQLAVPETAKASRIGKAKKRAA